MSTPFYLSARRFAQKVIRVRFWLIRQGCSGNAEADHAARELHMQLGYFPYDSDRKMASFFTRYEEQLLAAISGSSAKCHGRLMEEYRRLLAQAKEIQASPDAQYQYNKN